MSQNPLFAATIGTWTVYGKAVPIKEALAGFSAGLEQVRAEIAAAEKKKEEEDTTFSDCIKRLVKRSQPKAFLRIPQEQLIDYLRAEIDECNKLLELHSLLPETAHLFKEPGKSFLCDDAVFEGKLGTNIRKLRNCRLRLRRQLGFEMEEAAMQSLINQLADGDIASSSSCSML
jgi:hypothetical protein